MQTEYGTPATPQEYRLIVKVPVHEEAPAPTEGRVMEPTKDSDEPDEDTPSRPSRRRRRGRRRTGTALADVGEDFDGPDEEVPGTPSDSAVREGPPSAT